MPKLSTAAVEWTSRVELLVAGALLLSGLANIWGWRAPVPVLELVAGLILVLIATRKGDAAVLARRSTAQTLGMRVPVVPPNITISSLVKDYVLASEEQLFPVIANDYFVGMVSLHDALNIPRDRWETTEVGEIMSCAKRLAVIEEKEVQCENDLADRNIFGRTFGSVQQGAKR